MNLILQNNKINNILRCINKATAKAFFNLKNNRKTIKMIAVASKNYQKNCLQAN